VDEIRISSIYDIEKTYQLFAKDYPSHAARINKFIKRATISSPSGRVTPLGRLKINADDLNSLSASTYKRTLAALSKFSFYIACEIIADNVVSKILLREKVETPLLRAGIMSTLVHFLGRRAIPISITKKMIIQRTEKSILDQGTRQYYLKTRHGNFKLGRYYEIIKEYRTRNTMGKSSSIISFSYFSYEDEEVKKIFKDVQRKVMNYITQNLTNYEITKNGNTI